MSGRVACLAPGRPPHTFHSPDTARVRICPRCRRRAEQAERQSPMSRPGWRAEIPTTPDPQ